MQRLGWSRRCRPNSTNPGIVGARRVGPWESDGLTGEEEQIRASAYQQRFVRSPYLIADSSQDAARLQPRQLAVSSKGRGESVPRSADGCDLGFGAKK